MDELGKQESQIWECLRVLKGHTDYVESVAFRPGGRLLGSSSWDETIRLWDPENGQCLRTLRGHEGVVDSVSFSPDGSLLASTCEDRTVRLWDPETGNCLRTLKGHGHGVNGVAFRPDGGQLASASFDKTIRLWDPENGACLRTLEGHGDVVVSVAFSHDGKLLASSSWDKTVLLWDPETGKRLRTLEGHTDQVRGVAFSPDGRLLASSSSDEIIRLWDPESGECLRTLKGHRLRVESVAFSFDGKLLASAGFDYTIRLWDPETGNCLCTLEEDGAVRGITFSSKERLLASAGQKGTVRLWIPLERLSSDATPSSTKNSDTPSSCSTSHYPDIQEGVTMPKTTVTINRPPQVVWDYFLNPGNWERWWGVPLQEVSPGWQSGATLVWGGTGGRSTVSSFIPEREIQTSDMFMSKTYRFLPSGSQSTVVELEFQPRGGATFSDGGLGYQRELAASLAKLKGCVESATPPAAAPVAQSAPPSVRPAPPPAPAPDPVPAPPPRAASLIPASQPAPDVEAGAKKMRDMARTFLVIGILNILAGLLVSAVGWLCGGLSVLLGIWEIVNAYLFWSTPPKVSWKPTHVAILEIVNVLFGSLWSPIAGIANLIRLSSPEVKAYYAALRGRQVVSTGGGVAAPLIPVKKCPQCAEPIAVDALVCHYCGHQFTPADVTATRQQVQTQTRRAAFESRKTIRLILGVVLTAIGGLLLVGGGLIFLLFTVIQLTSPRGPTDNLGGFVGALVICSGPFLLIGFLLLVGGLLVLYYVRRAFGRPNVERLQARRDVPALVRALDYPGDAGVRATAVEALGQVGDTHAVPSLVAALQDREMCAAAARSLGQIGTAEAVAALVATLQDEGLRPAATEALVAVGAPAVEALVAALQDGDAGARLAAAQALDRLGWQPDEGKAGKDYWAAKSQPRDDLCAAARAGDREQVETSLPMTNKNYYLGVDSLDTAFEAIDTLSFCTVLDRHSGRLQNTSSDRISILVTPDVEPAGAIVAIFGRFTPGEMCEIEDLARYEHKPLREAITRFAATVAVQMQQAGASGTQHILGQPE